MLKHNRANTVLELFSSAVQVLGLPHCVRADRGGENVEVARFMLRLGGNESFITGRSVHNQWIERLYPG